MGMETHHPMLKEKTQLQATMSVGSAQNNDHLAPHTTLKMSG